MRRAALRCTQYRLALVGLVLAAAMAGAGFPASQPEAAAPGQVWAIALPAKFKTVSPAQLKWLSSRGVTTVVAFNVPKRSLPKLAAAATRAKLNVIAPMARAPKASCRAARGSLRTCAAVAPTAVAAVKLARRSLVDYVVVRVNTPRQLRMLRGSSAKRSRIVAVLPLSAGAGARAAWRAGVAYAAADPVLDLAVASAPASSPLLGGYLSDLPRSRTAAAAGPSAPTSLIVVGRTASTVSLRWAASAGGVSGYGVYTDGAFVLNVGSNAITLTGLQCSRTYAFAVDAYDAGGARSSRTSISTSTDICPGGGGGNAGDSVAPSVPAGLARTSSTQTSIAVSWSPATDNVGVGGYGLYRGGSLVGSSAVTSYSFSGLACGTSYSLAVDAYDAAGNRSNRTTISASTSACAGGGDTTAPSSPGSLARTGATTTSITVSWSASSDNVGVAGYGLYRNGTSTGSTGSTSSTFASLACGTSYTLGVDAYDAAGNRSTRSNLTTATSACPAPTDTQRPSVPQGLGFGAITTTTVALVWNASSDNIGVAGYRLSRNGVSVATVATPGYTYTSLACGTAYSFMVEAYDAAGNFSIGAEAVAAGSTLACSGGGPPPPPPPPPPPGGSANVYLSPSGSDSAACSASAPCRSFARAYTVAASGGVVSVGAGVYGPQFFAGGFGGSQAQGTKQLLFRGEPGNIVRQLHFGSANLTFDGINVDAGGARLGSGDGATFENGGEPFTFKNGSIGNVVDQKGAMIDGPGMVFDNVRFHDVVIQTSGVHSECIFASVPEGMIVRNSTFFNCAVMDIFFVYPDWWSPLPPVYGNVVLEGNTFGRPDGTYTLYIAKIGTSIPSSAPVNGWRIRNNFFESAVNIDAPIGTGNIFCGNTGSVSASWRNAC